VWFFRDQKQSGEGLGDGGGYNGGARHVFLASRAPSVVRGTGDGGACVLERERGAVRRPRSEGKNAAGNGGKEEGLDV
jgi:hypothetical protein